MMTLHRRWIAAIAFSIGGSFLLAEGSGAEYIVPQVGSQTQVQQTGDEFTITGGASSADGQALFHAFEQLGLSSGQTATFLTQPDVQSILGGVVSGEASYLDGLLRVVGSSADLYLINPAGILFGPNARLDLAGSFAATTASGLLFDDATFNILSHEEFSQLTGSPTGFVFAVDAAGAVVNLADLQVTAAETITLIGGQVISTGTLTAPDGEITIAAIPEAGLVRISHPDGILNLEIATLPEDAIAPAAALSPLSLPALLTGTPESLATGLSVQPDGTIALTDSAPPIATTSGSAIATGTLDATGTAGGDVTVVGDRVVLLDATVNASGAANGGAVRIGGDYQGRATLPGASLTYMDANSQITASAGSTGDGGEVILWSDNMTAVYGDIRANGGANGGDGGFVEVSGAQTLVFKGSVGTTAPVGDGGEFLLDPIDIVIRQGVDDGDDDMADADLLSTPDIPLAAAIPTEIYESELEGLLGDTDVTLRASDDIIIEDLSAGGGDGNLSFELGSGTVTFEAGDAFQMQNTENAIVAPGRWLTITAGTITTGILDTSDLSARGGDISLNATGAIATGDVITQGNVIGDRSGDVTITGSGVQTGHIDAGGGFSDTSRVELTATGGDIVVDTITAGGGGLDVTAARRFQALETFNANVRITLDSSTDAALIDFLMKGDPQPLVDAGLVDTMNQVLFSIPASISVSPDTGGGPIVIRHGGAVTTNFTDGNITIEGSGAFPSLQFVAGPNADHTIDIDPSIPDASFTGFTTLFPVGTFPDEASGTTGAILRGRGDATLVTSFQNQPFVPMAITDPPESGGSSGDPGTGGTRGGPAPIADDLPADTGTLETSTADPALQSLSVDDDETVLEGEPDTEVDSTGLGQEAEAEADCVAAIADRSANTVEITSTCEPPEPSELLE